MDSEYVGLAGFSCERKDRVETGGGGEASYVAETLVYDRLNYIEDD